MITGQMLLEWRQAKALAVANPNTDPETLVAFMEMYIECKDLRRRYIQAMNQSDLMDKLAEYFSHSMAEHYLTPELENLRDEIQELADECDFDLEV